MLGLSMNHGTHKKGIKHYLYYRLPQSYASGSTIWQKEFPHSRSVSYNRGMVLASLT